MIIRDHAGRGKDSYVERWESPHIRGLDNRDIEMTNLAPHGVTDTERFKCMGRLLKNFLHDHITE